MFDSMGMADSKQRLPERIADHLQAEILDARLEPDHRLPTETVLAEKYEVSRTVIREAARLLVQRGLVTVKPGRGMVVAKFDGKFISEQFALLMTASQGTFDQLQELRLAVEAPMASLAAQLQQVEIIAAMHQTIEDGEAAIGDRDAFLITDMGFHELLAEASGNPFFVLVSKPINAFLHKHYGHRDSYPSDPHRTLEEHREILRSIEKQDTLASRLATEEHLRRLLRQRRNQLPTA